MMATPFVSLSLSSHQCGRFLLIVSQVSQEHGVLTLHPDAPDGTELPDLPYGTRVRILTNHACATTAMHEVYLVTDGEDPVISDVWPIFRGW